MTHDPRKACRQGFYAPKGQGWPVFKCSCCNQCLLSLIIVHFINYNNTIFISDYSPIAPGGAGELNRMNRLHYLGEEMSKKTFDELREEARSTRKEIILDATSKLFKKKSIFKISMRDIAMEAGMSAGNIYFYFEDREAIVRELMLRDEKNIIDVFRSIIKIDSEDAKLLQQKIAMGDVGVDKGYSPVETQLA